MFQSHAGSIEARLGDPPGWEAQRPFQSHAGSIEARWSPAKASRKREFQSHAGSIEAGDINPRSLHFQCFNPTLVRLRPPSRAEETVSAEVSIPRWFD